MTPALNRPMAVYFKVIVILVDIGTTLSKKKKKYKNLLTRNISVLYDYKIAGILNFFKKQKTKKL